MMRQLAHAECHAGQIMHFIWNVPSIGTVLADIIMPELDGIEAIRQIRTDHPDLRIIAMSGGGQIDKADFLHMAEALGADRVIEKPVRSERLPELVGSVMANPARSLPRHGRGA
jgi:CheY-like chemotaxis protein